MNLRVNHLILLVFLLASPSVFPAESGPRLYIPADFKEFGERLSRFMQLYLGDSPQLMLSSEYAIFTGKTTDSMQVLVLPRTRTPEKKLAPRIRLGTAYRSQINHMSAKSPKASQNNLHDVWLQLPQSTSNRDIEELQSMFRRQDVIRSLAALGVQP